MTRDEEILYLEQRITELEQGIQKCIAWCDACNVRYHAIEELRALSNHD